MNFDPTKYFYTINKASCKFGVEVVLVCLETKKTKTFYMARFDTSEASVKQIKQHMDSLTDELMADFFGNGKKKDKKEKGKR